MLTIILAIFACGPLSIFTIAQLNRRFKTESGEEPFGFFSYLLFALLILLLGIGLSWSLGRLAPRHQAEYHSTVYDMGELDGPAGVFVTEAKDASGVDSYSFYVWGGKSYSLKTVPVTEMKVVEDPSLKDKGVEDLTVMELDPNAPISFFATGDMKVLRMLVRVPPGSILKK